MASASTTTTANPCAGAPARTPRACRDAVGAGRGGGPGGAGARSCQARPGALMLGHGAPARLGGVLDVAIGLDNWPPRCVPRKPSRHGERVEGHWG